jgi:hypothetical protein
MGADPSNTSQNETRYFFFKFGSSFTQETAMSNEIAVPQDGKVNSLNDLQLKDLKTILSVAKKILAKDLTIKMDEIASQIYSVSIIEYNQLYALSY